MHATHAHAGTETTHARTKCSPSPSPSRAHTRSHVFLCPTHPPTYRNADPSKVFSGEVGGARVHVAINGTDTAHGVPAVGTVPAALTTYAAIAELSPDLIINAGTAGGFAARGAKVGDIYLSSAVRARMRRHVRACSSVCSHAHTRTHALAHSRAHARTRAGAQPRQAHPAAGLRQVR